VRLLHENMPIRVRVGLQRGVTRGVILQWQLSAYCIGNNVRPDNQLCVSWLGKWPLRHFRSFDLRKKAWHTLKKLAQVSGSSSFWYKIPERFYVLRL